MPFQLMFYTCILSLCVIVACGENETNTSSTGQPTNKTAEPLVVNRIPELPASVAKPGVFEQGVWFVLFYTPWCERSKEALPHFKAAVQHIVDHNLTGVSIGKLDVSKESGMGNYFHIRSTPVVAIYRDGYRHHYNGEVTTDGLISFAVRLIMANATLVETREQLASLKHDHAVLFLLVCQSEVDPDWLQVYRKVAKELALRGRFYYTAEPGILDPPPSKLPAILVFKDEQQFAYTGALAGHALYKWVLTERFPALPTISMSTLNQFLVTADSRKLLILALDKDLSQRTIGQKKAYEVFKKLAPSRQLQKLFQFAFSEGKELTEHMLRQPVEGYPQLFAMDIRTGHYNLYRPEGKGYAESAIVEFLELVHTSQLPLEGGPTYKDTVLHLYRLMSAIVQVTLLRHPYLGIAAGFSVMGVFLFYVAVCCGKYTKRSKIPRTSRTRAKQLALARRHNESTVRRRHGNADNHTPTQEEPSTDEDEESSKDK